METTASDLTAGGQLSESEQRFDRWRGRLGLVLAPLAFAITFYLCTGLTPEGRRLAGILAGVCMLWITETVELPVTALLGASLCIMLGVGKAKDVLSAFADPIIFVFLGGFMIARAMMVHHLDRRIALYFLSIPWIGSTRAGMLVGLGTITAFISMWVSNTATTAMMLPIGLGMLRAVHRLRVERGEASGEMNARNWPFATAMMLTVAYGASIGGIGTPVGSPPNLIAIGLIRKTLGREVTFFQWMCLNVPLLILMGIVLFLLLYVLHPDRTGTKVRGKDVLDYLRAERRKLGAWTCGQVNTLIGFGVAVTLWVLPGILELPRIKDVAWAKDLSVWMKAHMPEGVVALIAAVLLFFLPTSIRHRKPTLTWRDAVQIDWGTILLFGGGLAIGALMFDTGVAKAMGESLTHLFGAGSLWMLTAIAILLGIILSETTSNTASANMVIPVAIAIAQAAGVSPLPPALGACLGASYGFMLPVSTPPNAIAYGSGLVPMSRMIRAGFLFDILGFFIILGGLRVLCPLLGLM